VKSLVFLALLVAELFAAAPAPATAKKSPQLDPLDAPRLDLAWVFFRNGYFYPVSGVRYASPSLGVPLSFELGLRGYGSVFFVSTSAMDLDATLWARLTPIPKRLLVTLGGGGVAVVRLSNDPKVKTPSGFVPHASASLGLSFGWTTLTLPVRMRFYANGYGVVLAPEWAVRVGHLGLFVRSEISWDAQWRGGGVWYGEHFAGFRFYLNHPRKP